MNAIELRGLCTRFGKKVAVDNIDLDVREGELFGLLGVNGAGKTTTIRMLCCLSHPDGGDATICGHSIISDSANVKRIIGISPQETSVAPNLTVRENFEFIAGIYGFDRDAALANIRQVAPRAAILDVSAKTGAGLDAWYRWIEATAS